MAPHPHEPGQDPCPYLSPELPEAAQEGLTPSDPVTYPLAPELFQGAALGQCLLGPGTQMTNKPLPKELRRGRR